MWEATVWEVPWPTITCRFLFDFSPLCVFKCVYNMQVCIYQEYQCLPCSLGFHLQDILCMPRVYCEKMKRRKHVIDQYPNTKKVAAWLVGRYKLTIMKLLMLIF